MEAKYRICFLGYRSLSSLARTALETLNLPDTDVKIEDCHVETLQSVVDRAILEGYEIFIAGSANAAEFRRHYHARLVEIHLRPVDYLIAIRKALSLGNRPVIALYRYGRPVDLPLLSSLSGIPLETIPYEDSAELQEGILHTAGDVIIGASHAIELASELGRKSVLLYPGEDSIKSSIRRARSLAAELEQEIQRTRTIQTILSDAPIGLIVSDPEGNITLFNRAARNYAQLGSLKVLGKKLREILPSVAPEAFLESGEKEMDTRKLVNDVMLRCVHVRIQDNATPLGVLTTLYPDNLRRRKEDNPQKQFRARASWKDVISTAPCISSLVENARSAADSGLPLLIAGEAGTGKSFYSQCIHNGSSRSKAPYIQINTVSIPDQECARILFGSEDSGGIRPGLLELAGKGTVVLQNLPLASKTVQRCLFQAVSEQSFLRLGGTDLVPFSARIITILDTPDSEQDIFPPLRHSVSVLSITVPPLRERREDILPLFSFLASQDETNIIRPRTLKNSEELLRYYSWPGNLTELASVCRRYAYLLSKSINPTANTRHLLLLQAIGEEHVFEEILKNHPALLDAAKSPAEEVLAGLEEIKRLLKYNNDTIAKKLSLGRTTLWRITKGAAQET